MDVEIVIDVLSDCQCIGIERDYSHPISRDGYAPYSVTYRIAAGEITMRTFCLPEYAYPEFFPPDVLLETIANGFEWIAEGNPATAGNYVYMLDGIFPFEISEYLLWKVVHRAGYTKIVWDEIKDALANRIDK